MTFLTSVLITAWLMALSFQRFAMGSRERSTNQITVVDGSTFVNELMVFLDEEFYIKANPWDVKETGRFEEINIMRLRTTSRPEQELRSQQKAHFKKTITRAEMERKLADNIKRIEIVESSYAGVNYAVSFERKAGQKTFKFQIVNASHVISKNGKQGVKLFSTSPREEPKKKALSTKTRKFTCQVKILNIEKEVISSDYETVYLYSTTGTTQVTIELAKTSED